MTCVVFIPVQDRQREEEELARLEKERQDEQEKQDREVKLLCWISR